MLLEEVETQNNQALQSIPVTDRRLLELKEYQDKDAVCTQIKDYVRSGWPSVSHISLFLSHTETTSSTLPSVMAC